MKKQKESNPMNHVRMKRPLSVLTVMVLLLLAGPVMPAERAVETFLPESCVKGWVREGPVSTYTRENLYKYIDGEAELYMPYGFERAATVMYVRPGDKENGLVVNVFKMGSLLDAFGVYANYRSPSLDRVAIGAEGFVDESQLMFFKDRYFVEIMASGGLTEGRHLFLACAGSVADTLPDGAAMPQEIELLKAPGLDPMTEKYFPEGLLGYGFFGKGLTAEVMVGGAQAKAFLLLGSSPEGMERTFDAYAKYLRDAKVTPQVSRNARGTSLRAVDPLFKEVVLQQSGRYGVGLAGLKDTGEAERLIDQLIGRLPKDR